MNKAIKNIELAFNCPQNWDEMTACGNGKFCSVCQKVVYDFTNKSQKDYELMVQKHQGNICGRFNKAQVKTRSSFAKVAALASFSFITTGVHAQEAGKHVPIPVDNMAKNNEKDIVFGLIIETIPEFIGGTQAMFQFLKDNLRYPTQDCVEGTVYVGFVVEADGTVSDVKVKRGINGVNGLNEEAIRVVKLMSGKWKAGMLGGKPTKVAFTIPIKFRL